MNSMVRTLIMTGRGIAASALCMGLVSCGAPEALEQENDPARVTAQAMSEQKFGTQVRLAIKGVTLSPIDSKTYREATSFMVTGTLIIEEQPVKFEFEVLAGEPSNKSFFVHDTLSLSVEGQCLQRPKEQPCDSIVLSIQYIQDADANYLASQHGLLLEKGATINSGADGQFGLYLLNEEDHEVMHYFMSVPEIVNLFAQ